MSRLPRMRPGLGLGEGYHSPQVDVDVRLNTNESPEPPPQAWRDAFAEQLATVDFHRYPDRSARRLRAALAELHKVDVDNIWCGNGSNEVLQQLLMAFGGPGRIAAVFEPTYALHSHIAELTGTSVARGGRRANFTLDPREVRRVIAESRPTVTFLCSPNNPTGLAEPPDVVHGVLDDVPGLLVVDEAYGQFARWSAAELVDDSRPLVVVRTFSKTWAMAALRLGYAIAPREVVAAMERVSLPYHLDAVKQIAGLTALGFRDEMMARVEIIQRERERLIDGLARLPVEVWPSEANFVLFRPMSSRFTGDTAGAEVWQALVDRSVLVRNCSSWDGLDGCLRVTIGTPDEDDTFLAALEEVLS